MSKAPGLGGWDALGTYPKAMQDVITAQYNPEMDSRRQKKGTKPTLTLKLPKVITSTWSILSTFLTA
jgi:hypothetical protein